MEEENHFLHQNRPHDHNDDEEEIFEETIKEA